MGPKNNDDISLREYLLERIKEVKILELEKWKGHEQVHSMGQKALDAAVRALDARLEAMNQFRAQVLEERSQFVRVDTYAAEHKGLIQKTESSIDGVESRLLDLEKYRSNMDGRLWMLAAVIGGGSTIVTIGLNLLFRYWGR